MSNGYIPGMNLQSFGVGLDEDIKKEQKAQAKSARGIGKWGAKKGLLGMLGSKALDFVGSKALTGVLAGAGLGPLAPFVAKAITKGGGHLLGQTLAGKGPEVQGGGTGLLGSGLDRLDELKGGITDSLRGQALGMAGSAFTGDAWKKVIPGLQMDVQSGFGKAISGLGFGKDAMSPEMMAEIAKAKGSDMYQNAGSLFGMQEGGSTFNVDYDSIADYARNMRENRKEDDFLGFMESPDIANALAGELTLRRDYKTTPEERDAIERTTANRKRKSNLMQMLDMDKSLGSSPVDDTESAYLKSLAGSDILGKQATKFAESQDVYGSPSLDDSESAYLKSLQGSNRMGDLANLEQMKQGIGQAIKSSPVDFISQEAPSFASSESLAPMMNPFTGEELGEAPVDPQTGTFGMGNMNTLGNPYKNILELLGAKMPKELWAIGGEGGVNPEYVQEQRAKLGFQMGGMPGVSSPLPYNMGGSVAQQPMQYQVGGLLKYKRNPMVG